MDLTDDELILMYREGDAEAFDVLFDRHRTPVYNFAWMMLRDVGAAEDILQETFLAVVRAANRYEPRGHFRSWLLRIARNRCLNRLEAQRVRRGVRTRGGVAVVDPPSERPAPADAAAATEEMRLVERAIAALPERQREVIVLYAFEQMRYREIAEVMEMPINTVKTLIHRARGALARALDDEQEDAHAV